jgi:hypothetical protein
MATPWIDLVPSIVDGTPVNAATTNIPITILAERTQSLREEVTALEAGALLLYQNATIQAGVTVGMVVFEDTDGVFKPALSRLGDQVAGVSAANSAYPFGVVLTLTSSTNGAVVMFGRIDTTLISESQWAAVIDGGVWAAGQYFLSAINPGNISTVPGPLAIYIGQALPDGSFLAKVSAPVFGLHDHYEFALSGNPAGTPNTPSTGNPQTIPSPDASQRGWLPVSSFTAGWVPAGAKFGYNMTYASDAGMLAAFPPVPLGGSTFTQGGAVLDASKIVVNQFGIWWMDNSYGNAPWPVDWNSSHVATNVYAWWTRILGAASGGVVQSITNAPGTALTLNFTGPGGQPASDGPLQVGVTTILSGASDTDTGPLGLKSVTGGTYTRGPVASRLLPGPGITLSSTNGSPLTGFYGDVTVATASSDALQGNADTVALNNANYRQINDMTMIALQTGRNQNPVFSFNLSRLAAPTNNLTFFLWLYSDATGTIPSSVVVQYKIIPATPTNTALPTGWTTMTALTGGSLISGQAREFAIAPIVANVAAGSLVMLQVTRNAASSDGFSGNIYLVRVGYELS